MKLMILIKKIRYVLFLSFFFVSLLLTDGQQIATREFDEIAMTEYSEDNSFSYMNYTVKPPSIWVRLSWWFQNMFQRFFLNPNTPWLTEIGYYLILTLVIGAALFYIVRLKYGGALAPDSSAYGRGINLSSTTKDIDFDSLISESLGNKNFKLAIRYLYLKTLVSLSNQDLIKLRDWKSPYDYERELKSELAPNYKELARLFEYVWYGDFEAGEGEYKNGLDLSKKLEKVA